MEKVLMDKKIVITGIGMITSAGGDGIQSCASIRAKINRFQELEDYYFNQTKDPESGSLDPLVCAPIGSIDLKIPGKERWIQMIQTAIIDLIQNGKINRPDFEQTALFLAMPPLERVGLSQDSIETILPEFYQRSNIDPFPVSKIFPNGHASVYLAVEEAISMIRTGEMKFCIIGGVDSLLDNRTLKWLDENFRLKSERNRDGFIPGEASAFFLIEGSDSALQRDINVMVSIEGSGSAKEKNPIFSEKPCMSRGLAEAIRNAIEQSGDDSQIEWVLCDLNGETYRSKEWGLCPAILNNSLGNVRYLWHPADCLGDVGAASGAVLLSLASRAFQRGYAPSNRCLLWTSSDNGERSSLILKDQS